MYNLLREEKSGTLVSWVSSAAVLIKVANVTRLSQAGPRPSRSLCFALNNIMASLKRKRGKKKSGEGGMTFHLYYFGILYQSRVSQVLRQEALIHFRH